VISITDDISEIINEVLAKSEASKPAPIPISEIINEVLAKSEPKPEAKSEAYPPALTALPLRDETYVVSMTSIVETIRNSSHFILISGMLFFVLSIAAAFFYYHTTRPFLGTTTALISYGYAGAESGLDPMGNPLDVSKIKSPDIIRKALEQLDLNRLINVEDVRSCFVIGGVIPDNVLEQILIIREIATKSPSKLEELPEIQYHPIQYVLRLRQKGNLKLLSEQNMVDLLNTVIDEYSKFFIEEYSDFRLLDTIIQYFDQSQYDYHDIVRILEGQVNNMLTYCEAISEASPEYRSPTTNMTFGDIISNLELIKTVDLRRIGALVYSNNMSRDRPRLGRQYEYNIIRMQMEKNQSLANALDAERLALMFEKDYWLLHYSVDWNEFRQASDTYDFFMATAYKERANSNRLIEDIEFYENCVSSLRLRSSTADPRDVKFVEDNIPILIDSLKKWVIDTNKTTEDYLSLYLFKDATKVITPAKFRGVFSDYTKKMMLIILVGTFSGIFLAAFIALWREAFPVTVKRRVYK